MNDPQAMSPGELKSWLRDRLHLRGAAAADIDLPRGEAPYERPLALWRSSDGEVRERFKRCLLELTREACDQPWEATPFNELSLLLETAELFEAAKDLEDAAQSGRLLTTLNEGQLHMLVLRTLLALGWTGSREFWMDQKNRVGTRWPAVVFAGLARQGAALAFEQLPHLVSNGEGMRQILNLFPGLMRRLEWDMPGLARNSAAVVSKLDQKAGQALREWFELRDCPLAQPNVGADPTLRAAINRFLDGDSQPRVRHAPLSGSTQRDCVAA